MAKRRKLDRNEKIAGQVDIFDHVMTDAESQPRKPKTRKAPVAPGQPPRYSHSKTDIDCDHCFYDQSLAYRAGNDVVPLRLRARWKREAWREKDMYLCRNHGQHQHSRDNLPGKLS